MLGARPQKGDLFCELFAILGEEAMFALLQDYAGMTLYIPMIASQRSMLCKAIGVPALQRLVKAFSGSRISVPLAKRWRIIMLRRQGHSYSSIVRTLGVAIPTVHQALKEAGMTGVPRRKGSALVVRAKV